MVAGRCCYSSLRSSHRIRQVSHPRVPQRPFVSKPTPPDSPPEFTRAWFVRGLLRTSALVGLSMSGGDVLCQWISNDMESVGVVDMERSKVMAIVGTCVSGPLGHTWMVCLEFFLPGKSLRTIGLKIVANGVYAFMISLPVMFTSVTLLKGNSLGDAQRKISDDLASTWLTGVLYWPFCNLLTFRYVPIDMRAVVGSLFGVVWNVYLSFKANTTTPTPTTPQLVPTHPPQVFESTSN